MTGVLINRIAAWSKIVDIADNRLARELRVTVWMSSIVDHEMQNQGDVRRVLKMQGGKLLLRPTAEMLWNIVST